MDYDKISGRDWALGYVMTLILTAFVCICSNFVPKEYILTYFGAVIFATILLTHIDVFIRIKQ